MNRAHGHNDFDCTPEAIALRKAMHQPSTTRDEDMTKTAKTDAILEFRVPESFIMAAGASVNAEEVARWVPEAGRDIVERIAACDALTAEIETLRANLNAERRALIAAVDADWTRDEIHDATRTAIRVYARDN